MTNHFVLDAAIMDTLINVTHFSRSRRARVFDIAPRPDCVSVPEKRLLKSLVLPCWHGLSTRSRHFLAQRSLIYLLLRKVVSRGDCSNLGQFHQWWEAWSEPATGPLPSGH